MGIRGSENPSDFRDYLGTEFIARCRKNSRYSLRAFARSLSIGSSELSKLLNKKRGLSESMLARLSERLYVEPARLEEYRKGAVRRSAKVADALSYRQLLSDACEVLSDWYPLAILELMKCEGFRKDPRWISRRLGVGQSEIKIALARLQKLQLLKITKDGEWIDTAGATTVLKEGSTDAARRKLQCQILALALAAVEEIPIDQRDQTAMLMAIDTKKLAGARKKIKKFRRSLSAYLENSDSKNNVFYLSISLFPVLKNLK